MIVGSLTYKCLVLFSPNIKYVHQTINIPQFIQHFQTTNNNVNVLMKFSILPKIIQFLIPSFHLYTMDKKK